MFAVAFSACSLVSMFALLHFFLCGMFSHHVALEMRRLGALVVAVITGKRLFASVCLHVSVEGAGSIAGKVTLTTLKGLLS